MKKLLKYALLWHRYLGIGICLFFGIWFASGIVMMYARMPELLESDRLAHLEPLNLNTLEVTPDQAVGNNTPLQRIVVGMWEHRPVYRILSQDGKWSVIFADDGSHLAKMTPEQAISAVSTFSGIEKNRLRFVRDETDVDQWTVYPGSRQYLPFELIASNDPQDTVYYVSAATGGVFLVTTRSGRFWAWCGAIPHWWYIRALRANTPLWRIVMISASGLGVIMSIAGIVAGALRYSPSKRYRFRGGRRSSVPQTGMKRWHYILGYSFGFFTFTWIFSGLATMNPGHWSPGPDASLVEMQAFAGGPLRVEPFNVQIRDAARTLSTCTKPKEIELIMVNSNAYFLARRDSKASALMNASLPGQAGCFQRFPDHELLAASSRLEGTERVVESKMLTSYDAYYYDRHDVKPLPILRVLLSDSQKTQLYINPRTGMIQARYTDRSRLERWLYNGLHSLDLPFLYHRRPWWDMTVIVLSLGGLILSGTGIVLSFRYLRRSSLKRRHPVAAT